MPRLSLHSGNLLLIPKKWGPSSNPPMGNLVCSTTFSRDAVPFASVKLSGSTSPTSRKTGERYESVKKQKEASSSRTSRLRLEREK